jgi:hypothetical protein
MTQSIRVACLVAALSAALAGCSHETAYSRYAGYISDDAKTVQNLDPLPESDVKQLAHELCGPLPGVKSAVGLMTQPLPSGYDTHLVGIWQAARIAKAYCSDWTKAFVNLSTVVTGQYGRAAIYTIPQ